jgi:hypothetical protein
MIKKVKRGEKLIHVKSAEDFMKISEIDKKVFHTITLVIDNDIDFSNVKMSPIDASGLNIVIRGADKGEGRRQVLSNITIDNGNNLETGLFSKVKNLSVINVNLANSNIKGGSCTGSLAGSVTENAIVKNCGFTGRVEAEAYSGALFGTVQDLEIEDLICLGSVKAKDFVGGVAGVVNSVKASNSHISTEVHSRGRSIGNICGYNSEEQHKVINDMLARTMPYIIDKGTREEQELVRSITGR